MNWAMTLGVIGSAFALLLGVLMLRAERNAGVFPAAANIPTDHMLATLVPAGVALLGASQVESRPAVGGAAMLVPAIALVYTAGVLSLLPSPFLVGAAFLAFRQLLQGPAA